MEDGPITKPSSFGNASPAGGAGAFSGKTPVESSATLVIRPSSGWRALNLRELWEYRELLYFLVWRDLKVRYKQTVLGITWAVIQPVLMMIVFSLLFGQILRVPSNQIPYPVFAYAGLLPWTLFARGLGEGSTSLAANRDLITKVYFPRLLLPAATVFAGLVDFGISFGVLIALMLYFGVVPTLALVALPLFVLIATLSAMGIAFWFSALDARYRDVRYTIPFLVQLWLFATPVVYPMQLVPESWRWIFSLNPMVGVVEGFRWALLGSQWSVDAFVWLSVAVVLVVFVAGMYYFRRVERILADVV